MTCIHSSMALCFTAVLAVSLVLCVACGQAPSGSDERPNVLIISIDTLRADHLGCYGYERDTSPELDRFAAGALRYERAYTPAPWTLPAHAALFSGRQPHEIGIRDFESALPDDVELLAETMSAAGYQAAGFVDSGEKGFVGGERGFSRGFEIYEHAPFVEGAVYRYDVGASVDRAVAWLAEERETDRPFFLFLHTKSVHATPGDDNLLATSDSPYHKPAEYMTRFLPDGGLKYSWTAENGKGGVHFLRGLNQRIGDGEFDRSSMPPEKIEELIAMYDGGISYTDAHLGRFFDELEQLGLDDETLIVVVSDHGEAFLGHDLVLHKEVYESQLWVPLIVRYPRAVANAPSTGVIRSPVSLVDVVPTVLEEVGLSIPAGVTGRRLPTAENSAAAEQSFHSAFEFRDGYYYRATGLTQGRWKLVVYWLGVDAGPVVELFDLLADPREKRPVTDRPELREDMLRRALAWYGAPAGAEHERIDLDAETLEELRALGYLR